MAALTRARLAGALMGLALAGCPSPAPTPAPDTRPAACAFVGAPPEVDLVPYGADGVAPRAPRELPRLAVVIDDLGLHPGQLAPLWSLGEPLTWAILPESPHGTAYARWLQHRGASVIVHLPMEPMDPAHMTWPGFLVTGDPPADRRAKLTRAIAAVPGAAGLNNHMGSRLTREREIMRDVVLALPMGWVVLDSRTTRRSRLATEARGLRPVAERDVFLDNTREVEAILAQLEAAASLAETRGTAVAIGHPYPETTEALRRFVETNRERVQIVPLERIASPPVPARWRSDCAR